MHTSTGRFPFSRRSPSKRRAFLGVFNITKGFGRHDKCQRPRISLQIKRCQPITPPIIRRKHRELPIFLPEVGMQGPSIAEYSQKCTSPPPPHGANQNKSAAIHFRPPRGPKKPPAALGGRGCFFMGVAGAGKEGRARAGQLRQLTRRCKPSCACPRQHQTGCRSGSRGASSLQGRSRCSQPGRSRSRRRHRPCCRSRPPGR